MAAVSRDKGTGSPAGLLAVLAAACRGNGEGR